MSLTYFKDGAWRVPGVVLSVASVVKNDTQSSTSVAGAAFVDVTGLSITVTPQSDTSRFVIFAIVHGDNSRTTNLTLPVRIVRDATNIFVPSSPQAAQTAATAGFYVANNTDAAISNTVFVGVDSPATANEVTYKVQVGNPGSSSETVYVNRSRGDSNSNFYLRTVSSLTVVEVTA